MCERVTDMSCGHEDRRKRNDTLIYNTILCLFVNDEQDNSTNDTSWYWLHRDSLSTLASFFNYAAVIQNRFFWNFEGITYRVPDGYKTYLFFRC